ncbi:hypothetical protein C9J41_02905 [Photobacterium sp. GB-50]|nr:hypothetical protein C9J41_02905 [Photobacterium sp. GB-50]
METKTVTTFTVISQPKLVTFMNNPNRQTKEPQKNQKTKYKPKQLTIIKIKSSLPYLKLTFQFWLKKPQPFIFQ